MRARYRVIEPGLLQAFRLFVLLQWLWVGLLTCSNLGKHDSVPDVMMFLIFIQSTFLLSYLSWGWLQRKMGQVYLPLAIIVAALGPDLAQSIGTAARLQAGYVGSAALVEPTRVYILLLLPLLLISVQYGYGAVIAFVVGTPFLSIFYAFLIKEGIPNITLTSQIAGARLVLFFIAGLLLVRLSKAQRRERAEEVQKREHVAQYASTLEQLAVTRERNRIARELHDTLAHALSAVSVQLQALDVLWDSDPQAARQTLRQTYALTRNGLDEARRALHELRASPIESLGLALALRRIAEQSAERSGFSLSLALPEVMPPVRPEVEQHLYRIAEEALNNVARHARARHASVSLGCDAEHVSLIITDDGVGFDQARGAPTGHFGLAGMRERALIIDADLVITSRPRQGTTVRASVRR